LIRNFNAAVADGFRGNLVEYQAEIARAGRTPATAPAAQPPVQVIDPTSGEIVLVSREEAIRLRMTPAGSDKPKPPVGMRYDENNNLIPIQGSLAYSKMVDKLNKFDSASESLNQSIKTIDRLVKHPGRVAATGLSSITNIMALPGGDAKTFLNELNTFKSQAFLTNIDKLRGTGPLSNIEGEKLERAIGNIDPSSSEKEFVASMGRVKELFVSLKEVSDTEAGELRIKLGRKPKPGADNPGAGNPHAGKTDAQIRKELGF